MISGNKQQNNIAKLEECKALVLGDELLDFFKAFSIT